MAWWDGGGTIDNCVAAYDAIGASSLADSYTDESGSGNNAAPGVAPTWANGTGWTFNGSTQYLTTGVVPNQNYSVIMRFSDWTSSGLAYAIGGYSSGTNYWGLARAKSVGERYAIHFAVDAVVFTGADDAGVQAMTPSAMYWNGAFEQSITTPTNTGAALHIGRRSDGFAYTAVKIQAVAIYSDTLSAGEVATITTNMNALPNYSEGSVVPIIMQQHHAMGWR